MWKAYTYRLKHMMYTSQVDMDHQKDSSYAIKHFYITNPVSFRSTTNLPTCVAGDPNQETSSDITNVRKNNYTAFKGCWSQSVQDTTTFFCLLENQTNENSLIESIKMHLRIFRVSWRTSFLYLQINHSTAHNTTST
ncbi:hypothetical protein LXL04_026302 [Taraxacum kok-saghyz]